MSNQNCDGGRMNDLKQIAEQVTESLDKTESLDAARKLEMVALIIRRKVCAACVLYRKPFCRRQPRRPLFGRN